MDTEHVIILLPKYLTQADTGDGHYLTEPLNIDLVYQLLKSADGSAYLPDQWFHIYNYLMNDIITTQHALQWLDRLSKPGLAQHDSHLFRQALTNQQSQFDYQLAWPVWPLHDFEATYQVAHSIKPITNDDVMALYQH